jgi:hypothetical protein
VAAARHDQSAQDAKSAHDASGVTRTECVLTVCVLTVCAGVCADAIGAAIPTETTTKPASNSLKRVIGFIPFSTRGGRKRKPQQLGSANPPYPNAASLDRVSS